MRSYRAVVLGMAGLVFFITAAHAQDGRDAPPSGKAQVYVFRTDDANAKTTPGLWLNNRHGGSLAPRSYRVWVADPGPLEIHTGRMDERQVDTMLLTLRAEAGQTYYVRLRLNRQGEMELRQLSADAGRAGLRGLHRLQDMDPAAVAAPSAAPLPHVAPAPAAGPDRRITLRFKAGGFRLSNSTQDIGGASRDFADTGAAYGIEAEWRADDGLALGLELFRYSEDYTTSGSAISGNMTVTGFFFNGRKYFRTSSPAQPFLGIGVGQATADFSGDSGGLTGSIEDLALQVSLGLVYRWQRLGVVAELKNLRSEIQYGQGNQAKVDPSGIGLFAGVDVQF